MRGRNPEREDLLEEIDRLTAERDALKAEIAARDADPSYTTACETIRRLRAEVEALRAAFVDTAKALGCEPDNEAILAAIDALRKAAEPVARNPDGYAYRYPATFNDGTVIRFNSGQEVNGSRPIEAVPYWLGAPPPVEASQQQSAVCLIAAERARQIHSEGWTPEHDDDHGDGDLAAAAACYAWRASLSNIRRNSSAGQEVPDGWPWDRDWWKPASDNSTAGKVRELVKAGALIVAEIERLQRAEASQQQASAEKVVHIEGYDEWRAKQGSDERAARVAFVSQKAATQMVEELRSELSRLTAELSAAKVVLGDLKVRMCFMGHPGEAMWNNGTEDAPHWTPDWRFQAQSIEAVLHGAEVTADPLPKDTRRRDEVEAAAKTEAEALRKDAERYRWLRMNRLWLKANLPMIAAPEFDFAIDAAIAAQGSQRSENRNEGEKE